jgi:hypothetical protein
MQVFFGETGTRTPGSASNLAIERQVAERFAESGFEHGEIVFRAPCFEPGKTVLQPEGLVPMALHPVHPALFRPGNFKEPAFETRIVDLGRGEPEDLERVKGVDLHGCVALMDFDCGHAWQEALRFNIRGLIFVEPELPRQGDAAAKLYGTEVAVPRFLINREHGLTLKSAIAGAGGQLSARIDADPSRWENRLLRDLWVLIP